MLKLLIFLLFCELCFCYKILLVFPFPKTSHYILGDGYVKALINAGHEVTYITPAETNINHPRLRLIDISSVATADAAVTENVFNFRHFVQGGTVPLDRDMFMLLPANLTIFHENLQKLIHDPNEEFDVVIAEWMFVDLVGTGLAAVFNCPLIWSTSMETTNTFLSLVQSTMNPAYTTIGPTTDPPYSFWMRVKELYHFFFYQLDMWLNNSWEEDLFKRAFGNAVAKRGRVLPCYYKARFNASLVLANSHVATGVAMSLPQNYKQIGGYHIEESVKPLPKDLQRIMDESKYGVIYFSLGSMVHTKNTPDEIKLDLLNVFGRLKQTVIWKFDLDIGDVPHNVHLVKWAPQLSILAQKNCVLFITHGGLLSLNEAVHSAVPIIGIPLFADQFLNVNRAVAKGFGRRVSASMDLAKDLEVAIQDIIGNSSYINKAREYSVIQSHRVASPREELVFWTEHVVKTRGAPHLRAPAILVPFYQTMYLDLLLLLAVTFYGLYKLVTLIRRRGKSKKIKSD